MLASLVIQDPTAQRVVGRLLLVGADGGVDIEATGVNLGAVLREHELARHFGHVLGMRVLAACGSAQMQLFFFGGFGLGFGDEAMLFHALDDVELARTRALGVVDGVVSRRSLGQTRQHRCFGDGDALNRFAKVSLRRSGKAVSAVAQEDLVEVDLKNLVFAEHVLQLGGEQDLVNLARERFF